MERNFIPENPVGFFQIDLTGGAVVTLAAAWASAIIADPTLPALDKWQYVLLMDCEGNNVRYRLDGTAPTTAIGGRIITDTQFVYTGTNLASIKFIAETAANCKLNIHLLKQVA